MAEFKKTKKKNLRKRRHSSDSDFDSDENNEIMTKVDDIKELQKLRERPKGVSSVGLALGKKISQTEDVDSSVKWNLHVDLGKDQHSVDLLEDSILVAKEHDPFKMKTGGYVDMKELKSKGTVLTEEEKDAIGTAFAAETNRRDEDTQMLKYVEEELQKRKGIQKVEEQDQMKKQKAKEDAMYQLPDVLKSAVSKTKKTEDMLSNQMLSGIPEIDLGIEAKIKNIEETEEAKQKLIKERMTKKEDVSEFVPTNMAVNFVQHNRFNIEDTAPILKKADEPISKQARVGDADKNKPERPLTVQPDEKATDNFYFEKFKKQMRR